MTTWDEIRDEIAGMLVDGEPLENVIAKLEKYKNEMTNEACFCGLSIKEKAKWLEEKMTWAAQEQGIFTAKGWEKWLKEKHNG